MEMSEIKSRLTLSQVLQHYGLKPDKHMRQVYYKTHTAYCFSGNCKTHGRSMDVIDFVMHKENCTKHEAIEKCKAMLSAEGSPLNAEALTRTAVLTKMFTYFKNAVHNSKPAQDYLQQRCLNPLQIEVGYNTAQFHHGSRKEEALINSCVEVGLLRPLGYQYTRRRAGIQAVRQILPCLCIKKQVGPGQRAVPA